MGAQKGRLFLLKVSDGTSPVTYNTLGGLRATSMAINNQAVDITTKDEAPWKTLLANAGDRSVSLSGSGIYKGGTEEGLIRTMALGGTIQPMEIIDEAGNKFTGNFQVTKLEYTGNYNGAQEYSTTLESSGTVSYTAGP